MISRSAAVSRESPSGFATADVEDVLQPGETRTDEARVDQAVGQRVELVAAPAGHHEQQKQALGRLLDERRADGDARPRLPSPDLARCDQ